MSQKITYSKFINNTSYEFDTESEIYEGELQFADIQYLGFTDLYAGVLPNLTVYRKYPNSKRRELQQEFYNVMIFKKIGQNTIKLYDMTQYPPSDEREWPALCRNNRAEIIENSFKNNDVLEQIDYTVSSKTKFEGDTNLYYKEDSDKYYCVDQDNILGYITLRSKRQYEGEKMYGLFEFRDEVEELLFTEKEEYIVLHPDETPTKYYSDTYKEMSKLTDNPQVVIDEIHNIGVDSIESIVPTEGNFGIHINMYNNGATDKLIVPQSSIIVKAKVNNSVYKSSKVTIFITKLYSQEELLESDKYTDGPINLIQDTNKYRVTIQKYNMFGYPREVPVRLWARDKIAPVAPVVYSANNHDFSIDNTGGYDKDIANIVEQINNNL